MPQVGLYTAFLALLFPPNFFHLSSAVASSSSCDLTVAPPSHGDLWLRQDKDGLVLIYMGPDGTDYPQMWGTLSASGIGANVANTLCSQLGYFNGSFRPLKDDSGIRY